MNNCTVTVFGRPLANMEQQDRLRAHLMPDALADCMCPDCKAFLLRSLTRTVDSCANLFATGRTCHCGQNINADQAECLDCEHWKATHE